MEGIIESTTTALSPQDAINQQFTVICDSLTNFRTQFLTVQQQLRTLEKNVAKELKSYKKESDKKKLKLTTRKPSGFAKPTAITADLAAFMRVAQDTLVARTDVTKFIIAYINENKLQNEANHKIILPDAVLQELLKVPAGEELTYFNLQKYMNPHFVKTAQ
jgi:chromatin remodeling complex protein RSC6